MGSGASSSNDLSNEEKSLLAKAMEVKYQSIRLTEMNETKKLSLMQETYLVQSEKIRSTRNHSSDQLLLDNIPPIDDLVDDEDEDDHYTEEENKFRLKATSMIYQPFSDRNDIIGDDQQRIRSRTSSELLDLAHSSVQDEHNKLADFIQSIKSGDSTPSKVASSFRIRRLTYSNHSIGEETVDENKVNSSSDKTITPVKQISPKRASIKAQLDLVKKPYRTTIFASSEIGYISEKLPPFPDTILGTYSCHGIEPSHYEEEGVVQKINQDRGCVVYPYNSNRKESLFIVLDGHGEQGDKVSEFVMRQIVISLEKDSNLEQDPVKALKNTFISTDTALMITEIHYMTSGCTCVAIYMRDNKLYVANVGDSRAVMAYKPIHPIDIEKADLNRHIYLVKDLSRDHKPDDPLEMERILRMGGFVCPPPEEGLSARVYLDADFTMIGLAMARSIGDHAVKAVGVIAEPEVLVFDLEINDQFMILASDGVWEFMTSQEAVDIVQKNLFKGSHEACQMLIEEAAARWQEFEGDYRDDITAIVVNFPLPYLD